MLSHCAVKNGPVNARYGVQAEFHHHTGKKHTHGTGRDGMSIGEPEVKWDDRGLPHKTDRNQEERENDQSAKFSAPVLAYSNPIPITIMNAPTVFTIAKL